MKIKNWTIKTKIIAITCIVLALAIIVLSVHYFGFVIPNRREEERIKQQLKLAYQDMLDGYERENIAIREGDIDVVFLGDSLTQGYDLMHFYPQYKVLNRGIGGETTEGLLNRMKVSVYDVKPKVVVMLIGGNNLLSPHIAGDMFNHYEQLLIGLKNNLPNSNVIILSLTAMGGSYADRNALATLNNVKIESLASKYGYDFVDLFSPLYDIETGEIYKEYTSDSVHLTLKGYEVLTAQITPAIEKALNK